MHPPHGYTLLDVITATAVLFVAVGAIVLFVNPNREVKEAYDVIRENDVRNIAEAYFEFSYREPEAFATLLQDYGDGRFIIGQGDSCAGSFGIQCSDAVVSDRCLDLSASLAPEYLTLLPFDVRSQASQDQTGYFFEWTGEELVIGACNPEATSNIEIRTRIGGIRP